MSYEQLCKQYSHIICEKPKLSTIEHVALNFNAFEDRMQSIRNNAVIKYNEYKKNRNRKK